MKNYLITVLLFLTNCCGYCIEAPVWPDVVALAPSGLCLCLNTYMTKHIPQTIYFPTSTAQGIGLTISTVCSCINWTLETLSFTHNNMRSTTGETNITKLKYIMALRSFSKIVEVGILILVQSGFLLRNGHLTDKKYVTGTAMYLLLTQLMSFGIVSWYKYSEGS